MYICFSKNESEKKYLECKCVNQGAFKQGVKEWKLFLLKCYTFTFYFVKDLAFRSTSFTSSFYTFICFNIFYEPQKNLTRTNSSRSIMNKDAKSYSNLYSIDKDQDRSPLRLKNSTLSQKPNYEKWTNFFNNLIICHTRLCVILLWLR